MALWHAQAEQPQYLFNHYFSIKHTFWFRFEQLSPCRLELNPTEGA